MSHARARILRLVLIAAVSGSWLFAPKPRGPEEYCGTRLEWGAHAGLTINCDSTWFSILARDPGRLLTPNEVRQSRPVFIIAGAVAGRPLAVALARLRPDGDPLLGYFVGYIVLNFLALVAAIEILASVLLRAGVRPIETVLLSVFVVANDVTKAFLWTPHTQILGLLAPLLTIAVAGYLRRGGLRNYLRLALLGLGTGLAILAYGAFFVTLAVWLITIVTVEFRTRSAGRALLRGLTFGVSSLVPVAVWPLYVQQVVGSYYSHEIEAYRQYVWLDAWTESASAGWAASSANLARFLATVIHPEVSIPGVAFVALFLFARLRGGSSDALDPERRALSRDIGLYLLVAIPFFALMGYYVVRLTYGVVPPLTLLAGVALSALPRWNRSGAAVAVWIGGFAWWLFHFSKIGPFS